MHKKFIDIISFGLFSSCYVISIIVYFFGIKKIPSDRCSHTKPTATGGGIAIIIPFLGYLWISKPWPNQILIWFTCASIILGTIGFIDDLKGLSYKTRLIAQTISAICIIKSGIYLDINFFNYAITIVFFLALINGCNFIDGLDGLLICSVSVCLLHIFLFTTSFCTFALLICCLTFMKFNLPQKRHDNKASIFLGDIGSTFLGFSLAVFALLAQKNEPKIAYVVHALFPMAFIGFDVFFTLISRILRRCNVSKPHREHFIHILNDAGYSHKFITTLYCFSAIICSIISNLVYLGYINFLIAFFIYLSIQIVFVLFVKKQSLSLKNLT